MSHDRAVKLLTALFAVAVIVSIVHYADNYFNYEEYPKSDSLPNPSAALVGLSWFFFTALGIGGYLLFRRRSYPLACLLLAAYSGSGLVGILHYSADGMTDAVWWRQMHVIADIACGAAVFAFAVWAGRSGAAAARGSSGSSRQ